MEYIFSSTHFVFPKHTHTCLHIPDQRRDICTGSMCLIRVDVSLLESFALWDGDYGTSWLPGTLGLHNLTLPWHSGSLVWGAEAIPCSALHCVSCLLCPDNPRRVWGWLWVTSIQKFPTRGGGEVGVLLPGSSSNIFGGPVIPTGHPWATVRIQA